MGLYQASSGSLNSASVIFMSLWYESLSLDLYDCGDNVVERALHIFAYLSMPVPRSWWEHALRSGYVDDIHASVLRHLRMELSKVVDLRDKLSSGLLVALAFIDGDMSRVPSDRFGDVDSRHSFDEYLTRAKKVLAERQELAQLGSLIDEEEK
jgi:hypothetical protein